MADLSARHSNWRLVADVGSGSTPPLRLWVVAPTSTPVTKQTMKAQENQEWRFKTRRRLLINWQAALPDTPGSDTLSLFGEIWKCAGGR